MSISGELPLENNENDCQRLKDSKNIEYYRLAIKYDYAPIGIALCPMIFGRLLNRIWRRKTFSEKVNTLKKYKYNFLGSSAMMCGLGYIIYDRYSEVSVIGRRRFMFLSNEFVDTFSNIHYEKYENKSLKSYHKIKYMKNVMAKIVLKNKEIYPSLDRKWSLSVLFNDDIKNCGSLSAGQIIFYTGMDKQLRSHRQLDAVLAHEMAHATLEHVREIANQLLMCTAMYNVYVLALYTFVPSLSLALFSSVVTNILISTFWLLPQCRKMEFEADRLGVEFLARGCLFVEDSLTLLKGFQVAEEYRPWYIPLWILTHPETHLRIEKVKDYMAEARKLGEDCGCFAEKPMPLSAFAKMTNKMKLLYNEKF